MKTATVTEAKNGLSALLDQVKGGHEVLITDRGIPVARLVPATPQDDDDARLARLERAGLVRRGTGVLPPELFAPLPEPVPGAPSLSEAVIEERRSGW
ncbi:MAG: type II toxin-antitoxin system prevent-host-death family antitoxin [Chloroflexota bacterium]